MVVGASPPTGTFLAAPEGVLGPSADAAETITSALSTPKRTLVFPIAPIETESTAALLAALSTSGAGRQGRRGAGSSPARSRRRRRPTGLRGRSRGSRPSPARTG